MANKTKFKVLSLSDYLGAKNLSEHLKLTDELTFHWANWDQTCLAQRRHYKNFNNNYHLMQLNETLKALKLKPVWLCNKTKSMKSDLYSLYESYLDSRLRLTWFERKDEILFSFGGEQGPYFTLTSMKWIDNEIYSQFVLRKILLEQYTLRSFRLNANIPIVFKLNNDVNEYADKVIIHQLSEIGFIFKIKDKNFVNKIKNSKELEFKIPLDQYSRVVALNVEETFKNLDEHKDFLNIDYRLFKLDSRILNFYGNMKNVKHSSGEEFCIFARYEDLISCGHDANLKDVFARLVDKTKDYFSKSLEDFEINKIWKKSA